MDDDLATAQLRLDDLLQSKPYLYRYHGSHREGRTNSPVPWVICVRDGLLKCGVYYYSYFITLLKKCVNTKDGAASIDIMMVGAARDRCRP